MQQTVPFMFSNNLLATGGSYIASYSLFIILAIRYSSCSRYLGI